MFTAWLTGWLAVWLGGRGPNAHVQQTTKLAITKLAIKSVARLTKIAHWAERQFDFVFFSLFLVFFAFLFLRCLFAVVFGSQVAHTRCRLAVRYSSHARWLRSYSNEMFAPAHYIIGLNYCIFQSSFLYSIFHFPFSIRCVDCAWWKEKNAEISYTGKFMKIIVAAPVRVAYLLFTFAARKNDGQSSISLEAAAALS